MIRSHRRRHLVISTALLLLLPALVSLALVARRLPPTAELPNPLRAGLVAPQMTLKLATDNMWLGMPITSYLFADAERYLLFLFPEQVIRYPDMLVYWSDSQPAPVGPPPAAARLLGTLPAASVTRLELEPAMFEAQGTLFLYSLGHQRTLSSVTLPLRVGVSEAAGE